VKWSSQEKEELRVLLGETRQETPGSHDAKTAGNNVESDERRKNRGCGQQGETNRSNVESSVMQSPPGMKSPPKKGRK
jgi:hypothetical protein